MSIPFVEHLGLSELHYVPRAEHVNSFDISHGGAIMTLLDVVMATLARRGAQDMGVITIEMKTSFMRPAKVVPSQSGARPEADGLRRITALYPQHGLHLRPGI